ncbi:MAG: diphosphomevalonate decarboxylase [Cardiobacteriaceae bacterium]|nr:diphosphomevalonate decarboxylase [Cardiobacteriaceae bacterium]
MSCLSFPLEPLLPKRFDALINSQAFAPSNIALSKYWGKRNHTLNLPTNSSFSISLGNYGTHTQISPSDKDTFVLNGETIAPQSALFQKTFTFVERIRRHQPLPLTITTNNNIPTAAGLASSASGFAALTKALCHAFQLHWEDKALSILARMGSGSASRSLWHGFVLWQMGMRDDGMDCYAKPLDTSWQDLRLVVVLISTAPKALSSTQGMNHTVSTSPLYKNWAETAEADVKALQEAIAMQDFALLGKTAEANALAMHATMLAARPAVCYFAPRTLSILQTVWALRAEGLALYATIDAGANVKLLYPIQQEEDVQSALKQHLPNENLLYINPFISSFPS